VASSRQQSEGKTLTDRANAFSPKTYAQIAGFLYLIVISAGVFAEKPRWCGAFCFGPYKPYSG